MKSVSWTTRALLTAAAVLILGLPLIMMSQNSRSVQGDAFDRAILINAHQSLEQGKQTFRFDTFGDEAFWGGSLKLHQAIAGEKLGGVGPGVGPRDALAVGLKVDAEALTPALTDSMRRRTINLNDPAITLLLLKLNAVIGVTGFFDP